MKSGYGVIVGLLVVAGCGADGGDGFVDGEPLGDTLSEGDEKADRAGGRSSRRSAARVAPSGSGDGGIVPTPKPPIIRVRPTYVPCYNPNMATWGPVAVLDATVKLDNRFTAWSDGYGTYGMTNLKLLDGVPGMPAQNHFLIVTAPGFRTKIIRFDAFNLGYLRVTDGSCWGDCFEFRPQLKKITDPPCAPDTTYTIDQDRGDWQTTQFDDRDGDGADDVLEDWLAYRFAPIVYHGDDESNWPVNVDWLLSRTKLRFYDDECDPDLHRTSVDRPSQLDLLLYRVTESCGDNSDVASGETRSVCKQRTYYLQDVAESARAGTMTVSQWKTYVHSYLNVNGGITIQYWRVYAYNDAGNNHGGDWEGIQVHLDNRLEVRYLGYLGHTGIETRIPTDAAWEGEHPKVWVEGGGHASKYSTDGLNGQVFSRWETWTGGKAWGVWGNLLGTAGGLVNVGEKSLPRNSQWFIKYSGIWGSPGSTFISSGYWGPAFNETAAECANSGGVPAYESGIGCDDVCRNMYFAAWCQGMDPNFLNVAWQCSAQSTSR
ncbi:MAG: hypothetical protein HYY84_18555 [Deltaproteobacteria bacterium]|nr:hypothetical protein [Deltaproteobacteria bacterium]